MGPAVARLVPTPRQLAWQQLHVGVFVHFGINTFFGAEWSDGSLPAGAFNPTELDADQWVAAAKLAGAKYLVLTAKHHDGFCLWPTATTDYSVAASPWRAGQGDVVAEVSQACARAGMRFGVYLSPWDRNAACYADNPAYDRFYIEQLTELCTRYGPLVEVWFDGAGSVGRTYDWNAIVAVIREHQPDAVIFNMGSPDIRWVGNEDGLAADPVEYVTEVTEVSNYGADVTYLGEPVYLPPECDVSIRRGWFWAEDDQPKSLEHLLGIYYRSVGLGAGLLLNLPPDNRGLIPDEDVARLEEFRDELEHRFGNPVRADIEQSGPQSWTVTLPESTRFDHLILREDYSDGQRVTAHEVLVNGSRLTSGLTIAEARIHAFDSIVATELTVLVAGVGARLRSVEVYDTGGRSAPEVGYRAPTVQPDVVSG